MHETGIVRDTSCRWILPAVLPAGPRSSIQTTAAISIAGPVRGACEILGLDPLYVANEGRFVAFVAQAAAEPALALLRGFHADAAVIGRVEADAGTDVGTVSLDSIGGARVLDRLSGAQLPRIC